MAAVENELRSYLDSGEKLLWAGHPAQNFVVRPLHGYVIAFAVFCLVERLYYLLSFWTGIYILIAFADLWYRPDWPTASRIGALSSYQVCVVAPRNRCTFPPSLL